MRKHDHSYYYSDIYWRFSGLRMKVVGFDPLILLPVPLAFFGVSREMGTGYFVFLAAFSGIVAFAGFAGHPSLMDFLKSLRTRYIWRCKWKTR
tara:strand:- start:20301 stop:20579 length:279 start_codon:yes stop_codon:yes gene_type:complete